MPPWCTCLHRLAGLCKVSAAVVYKKSRCRLISVLFASIFCDLNIKIIEKFQANNYHLPHWKKDCTICHWKSLEIRPGMFGRMVSALAFRMPIYWIWGISTYIPV